MPEKSKCLKKFLSFEGDHLKDIPYLKKHGFELTDSLIKGKYHNGDVYNAVYVGNQCTTFIPYDELEPFGEYEFGVLSRSRPESAISILKKGVLCITILSHPSNFSTEFEYNNRNILLFCGESDAPWAFTSHIKRLKGIPKEFGMAKPVIDSSEFDTIIDIILKCWDIALEAFRTRNNDSTDNFVYDMVNEGNISEAIKFLKKELKNKEGVRFLSAVKSNFTNKIPKIEKYISTFITTCKKCFKVKAIYLEMNAFDLNFDRWYCDAFGYTKFKAGLDDLEWLSNWKMDNPTQLTLTGMKTVQNDYKWAEEPDDTDKGDMEDKKHLATLLVTCKYIQLIKKTIETHPVEIPVICGVHNTELFSIIIPNKT